MIDQQLLFVSLFHLLQVKEALRSSGGHYWTGGTRVMLTWDDGEYRACVCKGR